MFNTIFDGPSFAFPVKFHYIFQKPTLKWVDILLNNFQSYSLAKALRVDENKNINFGVLEFTAHQQQRSALGNRHIKVCTTYKNGLTLCSKKFVVSARKYINFTINVINYEGPTDQHCSYGGLVLDGLFQKPKVNGTDTKLFKWCGFPGYNKNQLCSSC